MQDVCDADDRVSSILTSTSIASLLPLLLPFLLPKVQILIFFHMKTNLSFLLFAGVMTMSSMIMNSCSSDEDERTEVPTQPEMQKSDKLQQISEVVNQANQKLAAL